MNILAAGEDKGLHARITEALTECQMQFELEKALLLQHATNLIQFGEFEPHILIVFGTEPFGMKASEFIWRLCELRMIGVDGSATSVLIVHEGDKITANGEYNRLRNTIEFISKTFTKDDFVNKIRSMTRARILRRGRSVAI